MAPVPSDRGVPSETFVSNSRVSLDGTTVTAVVPNTAATGVIAVYGVALSNLIQNPGAEEPLVGGEIPDWTEVDGTNWTIRTSTNPPPFQGSAYFFAGDGATAELSQDVDVSAFAVEIAAGTQQFEFEGFVRSFNQSPTDTSRIIIEYRNAANDTVLESFDSGEIANHSAWQRPSVQGLSCDVCAGSQASPSAFRPTHCMPGRFAPMVPLVHAASLVQATSRRSTR